MEDKKIYRFKVKEDCFHKDIINIDDYRGKVFDFIKQDDGTYYIENDPYVYIDIRDWIFNRSQLTSFYGRGFKIVSDAFRKYPDVKINLPKRGTKKSAGYDFCNNTGKDIIIEPNEKVIFATDIKVYMEDDEVLNIYIRSSLGIKKGLELCNGTGIIDSDFFENKANDGNIHVALKNTSNDTVIIKPFDNVVQGVFSKYLITEDDNVETERVGGIGSTGEACE